MKPSCLENMGSWKVRGDTFRTPAALGTVLEGMFSKTGSRSALSSGAGSHATGRPGCGKAISYSGSPVSGPGLTWDPAERHRVESPYFSSTGLGPRTLVPTGRVSPSISASGDGCRHLVHEPSASDETSNLTPCLVHHTVAFLPCPPT